jgi:hypothetical protein
MRRLWLATAAVWLCAALFAGVADQPLGLAPWTWGASPGLGLLAFAVTMVWVLPLTARTDAHIEWKDIAAEIAALAAPLIAWLAAAARTSPVDLAAVAYAVTLLALAGAWSRRLTAGWRAADRRWIAWLTATWAVAIAVPIGALIASEYWSMPLSGLVPLSPLWLAIEAGRGNLPNNLLAHGVVPFAVAIVGFALLRNRDSARAPERDTA